jgi:hypothetical protein
MSGRLWLRNFFDVVDLKWQETPDVERKRLGKNATNSEWTKFMGGVMDGIAERMNCRVIRLRSGLVEKPFQEMTEAEKIVAVKDFGKGYYKLSREWFDIDAVFVEQAKWGQHIGGAKGVHYGPFALPAAVAELENDPDADKIRYCLWKVCCIRAPVRVLMCYQKGNKRIDDLRKRLEEVIWGSSLMKGTDGDLLVIIGDDSKEDEISWKEYFTVFEWRRDTLERVEEPF